MRQITIAELQTVLAANCDFHDTEVAEASYDPAAATLTLGLRDVYHIGEKSKWWEVSIPSMTLALGGLYEFTQGDLGEIIGYCIYSMTVETSGRFFIQIDIGPQLGGVATTVHIAP